jgi:hypothetical protein
MFYNFTSFITVSMGLAVSLAIAGEVWLLPQWGISEHKTVNTPQKLMQDRMFN